MSHENYLNSLDHAIITTNLSVALEGPEQAEATLFPVNDYATVDSGLIDVLFETFNQEIALGQTYPQFNLLSRQEFVEYWFSHFAAILVKGHYDVPLGDIEPGNWQSRFLGSYYIKPNYKGRASHICNAGFIVAFKTRGSGYKVGSKLAETYLQWAPLLGYTYSVFNMVFESNIASVKIWDRLGFERIGYVKKAGFLKGIEEPVGAIIYGKELQ